MKLRGIVKGQTIVFSEPLDLKDGQHIEVEVTVVDDTGQVETAATETGSVDCEEASIHDSPAHRTFRPIPKSGYVVTNEMVNEIREELGF